MMIFLLLIITFGIYAIYWFFATRKEINELGGSIPTAWLTLIPIANWYWYYRYSIDYAKYVSKDNNELTYFLLWIFISFVAIFICQDGLNNLTSQQ